MNEALASNAGNDWLTRERMARIGVVLFFFALEVILALGVHCRNSRNRGLQSAWVDPPVRQCMHVSFRGYDDGVDHCSRPSAITGCRIVAQDQRRCSAPISIMVGVLFLPERGPLNIYESAASSSIMILASNILCVYVLRRLGRSFSIMAEARVLVTDGPYALIRHPLYVVEEIGVVGVFIQLASWPAAMLFMTHFVFQLQRMRNEERVLTRAFPRQYRTYAVRTARLIPGVW